MNTHTKGSYMSSEVEFGTQTFENKRQSSAELENIAKEIRRDIIKMLVLAGSGHSGGPLGSTDIFTALYFNGNMRYDNTNPSWQGRDRFVLSAGHMAPVMYAALASSAPSELKSIVSLFI